MEQRVRFDSDRLVHAVMLVLSLALATLLPTRLYPDAPRARAHIAEIHNALTVVDAHCDALMRTLDAAWSCRIDLGQPTTLAVDLPKLRQGGVDVQFFAAFSARRYHGRNTLSRALAIINALYFNLRQNPGEMLLIRSVTDLDRALARGHLGAVLTIEGADFMSEPFAIELLHQLYDLGVRVMGLTWNDANDLAEGVRALYADGRPSDIILTPLGRQVIQEMNRLGIVVDVSHASERASLEIIGASAEPVMASHSNVFALRQHLRNLTDEQIQAIAAKGGVVHIMYGSAFLSEQVTSVSAADVANHIDYVARLVGPNHVGLGSDFDGIKALPDLKDASMIASITSELLDRGYRQQDLKSIMGGNTLELCRRVWKAAPAEPAIRAVESRLTMGETLAGRQPELRASTRAAAGGFASYRVIVDGHTHVPEYLPDEHEMRFLPPEPLSSGFHVVTFEARAYDGLVHRDTVIFRVN